MIALIAAGTVVLAWLAYRAVRAHGRRVFAAPRPAGHRDRVAWAGAQDRAGVAYIRTRKAALVVAVIAALVVLAALAGCSGPRPTVDAVPAPTEDATTEAAPDWVTCADWTARGTVPATTSPLVIPKGLSPADTVKYLDGLDNYCSALPADPLFIASDSVMLCLWPDQAQSLRGPDCDAVNGRLG